MLDEITTHLDFHTVTALVGALSAYDGAVLLVSHDRFLIRCVIDGEPPDPEDSSDDEDSQSENDDGKKITRRNMVYELRSGRLVERVEGMKGFEQGLVKRVAKMGL